MRIFIVEDNARHLKLLKLKVEALDYLVVGTSQKAEYVLPEIKKTSPDIVLVDINLGEGNSGIDLAKQIKKNYNASILFVTSQSKDEIIQDAIAIEPAGYLIKPVDPVDLKANIELAMYKKTHLKKAENQATVKPETNFLTVRTGKKLQLLQFKDIKILKVDIKNHVTLVDCNEKEFVIRDSLKHLLNSSLSEGFIRTHHSYGINIDYILFIDEKEQMVHLKSNCTVPIGKAFKKLVYEKMNIKS